MSIKNYHDLYEAIQIRHAVRAYDGRPLLGAHLETLKLVCSDLPQLAPGARAIIVEESGKRIFNKLFFKGVLAYLVLIGDSAQPHVEEAIGYVGEYIVLTATSLGVGTCWVGGTFNRNEIMKKVDFLTETEKIYAVSPLGYPGKPGFTQKMLKKITNSGSRKPLTELLSAGSRPLSDIPYWAKMALEAARLAPSAVNRQPWQFTVTEDSIRVSVGNIAKKTNGDIRRLDCGIAMLHLELGAVVVGETGEWQLLDSPDVASYIIKKGNQSFNFSKSRKASI